MRHPAETGKWFYRFNVGPNVSLDCDVRVLLWLRVYSRHNERVDMPGLSALERRSDVSRFDVGLAALT